MTTETRRPPDNFAELLVDGHQILPRLLDDLRTEVLEIDPGHRLQYSHFSPLTGDADVPENYHTVTIDLAKEEGAVRLTLLQDNNPTEKARQHSEENWKKMLSGMKKVLES